MKSQVDSILVSEKGQSTLLGIEGLQKSNLGTLL